MCKRNRMTINEKINILLTVIAIFISGFTCYLAHLAYEKFAYQQIQSKQIEAVTDLVEYIHKSTINLLIAKDENVMTKNATLFELSEDMNIPDSLDIYFKENQAYPLLFTPFVINPLIPKEIADILIYYHSYPISLANDSIMRQRGYIVLTSLEFIEEQSDKENNMAIQDNKSSNFKTKPQINPYFQLRNAPAYQNYGELVKYSMQLKNTIKNWYKKQGVDYNDINIRDNDFIYSFH